METIGVNLLWLEPGVVGGSEEYTLSLLRAVHALDPLDLELRIYAQPGLLDHHPDIGQRFEVVTPPRLPGGKAARITTEHTWLGREASDLPLVHFAGGVVAGASDRGVVLTILDLQPLEMPENFGAVKRSWLGQMIPRSVRRADLIVVPSRFTGDRLTDLLEVDPDRIRVVPFGLDAAAVASDRPSRDQDGQAMAPLFVYPAIAYPHKRHVDLIEAFSLMRADHPTATLVLTGREGPCTGAITEQVEELGLGEVVRFAGRLQRDELESLYARACAVVIPSEYEGFGLPALEAMALGTPVIVADAGSLPEVVGAAGTVVPARDPVALARAMHGVITDPVARASQAERSITRARAFQWKKSGEALIGAYRDALAVATAHS